MKPIVFLLFSLVCSVYGFSQNEIPWTNETDIQWEDFKGSVPTSTDKSALTTSGITYEASIRSNPERTELQLKVYSFFDKSKSWKKTEEISDYLLRHEQVHFNITELHARLLRKAFTEYDYPTDFDGDLLDRIFEENQSQLDSVQRAYDADTSHSRFEEGQKLWDQFIETSLTQFENYSDTELTITISKKD